MVLPSFLGLCRSFGILFSISVCGFISNVQALTFVVKPNSDIVGDVQTAVVQSGESLADIGKQFGIGVYEMLEANHNVDLWSPEPGSVVLVPTQFILPKVSRKGLVINLAEMRIYHFYRDKETKQNLVSTFPIGIGLKGWSTPVANGTVIEKVKDPAWYPPDSIRKLHEASGHVLPKIVPPGPENPLGKYKMKLSIPGYLIHGTNRKGGIGVRSSRGCIRLYPEDIEVLFYQVALGTPTTIVHEPVKYGWHADKLYAEVHEPLSDYVVETDAMAALNRFGVWSNDINSGQQFDEEQLRQKLNWQSSKGYPLLVF